MEEVLEEVWQWLTKPETGRGVTAVVGLLAIFAAVIAAPRKVRSIFPEAFSRARTAAKAGWRWAGLGSRSKFACFSLRLAVLRAGPRSAFGKVRESYVDDHTRSYDIAQALARVGELDQAYRINIIGAAWGHAFRNGPEPALRYLKERHRNHSLEAHHVSTVMETLVNDPTRWKIDEMIMIKFANILHELADRSSYLRLPPSLDDASLYLASRPAPDGKSYRRGNVRLLRPIDSKRLRALSRIVAYKAKCNALPDIVASLLILAYDEQSYRGDDTMQC